MYSILNRNSVYWIGIALHAIDESQMKYQVTWYRKKWKTVSWGDRKMETQDECFTRGPHELCFRTIKIIFMTVKPVFYSGSHYCNAIKVCSHYRNSQQILFFSIDQIYCLLKKCHWLENIIYLFQIMEWNIRWIFLFNIHELIYSCLGLNLKCNLGWSHRNSVDESKRNKSRQPCILKYGAPGQSL